MRHSFEPTPSTFSILKNNIKIEENIFINNNAIWDLETEIEFNDYGLSSSALILLMNLGIKIILKPKQKIKVRH